MKIILGVCLLVSTSFISSCSSWEGDVRNVDCIAKYETIINNTPYSNNIKVNQIRIDKFNNIWIRPNNTLDIKFRGRWERAGILKDYNCKGNDYGLRDKSI